MVNQTEQPIENTEAPDSGSSEAIVDLTSESQLESEVGDQEPSSIESPEESSPSTEVSSDSTPTEGSSPVQPSGEEPEPEMPRESVDALHQRLQNVEQQNAQYAQAQYQAQVQEYEGKLSNHYETQGYLPEQAKQMARNQVLGEVNQRNAQEDQVRLSQHLQGKRNAAVSFAKKYSLTLDDLTLLENYEDPQSMEAAAKSIQHNRDRDAELTKLRADRVPSQNFDDSQSSPAASTDEGRWLERYNEGDKSERAQAAGRRAALGH